MVQKACSPQSLGSASPPKEYLDKTIVSCIPSAHSLVTTHRDSNECAELYAGVEGMKARRRSAACLTGGCLKGMKTGRFQATINLDAAGAMIELCR
jgi:hypothetical protein